VKITQTLHLVASGASGFDLTHPLDCNVFLFTDGREHHLFDAGAGVDVEAILASMRFGGLDPIALKTLFLTHAHADHSGGAASLQTQFPGLKVAAGTETAALLAADDERLISLDRARGRAYPPEYVWRAPKVDRALGEGERVEAGPFTVTIHRTPGHSADHCCYTVEHEGAAYLIAGDALFAGGRVILQDIEDCSVSMTLASIRRLSAIDFQAFLPGHGAFSLRDGKRHVRAAMLYAQAGAPPPQF
jgi:glyoxylase-like metal-dependent hydrolase (beta-lactamase superfamily II)